jgi:hypothetical protein
MSSRILGLVKWYNEDKRFGFISLSMEVKMYLFTFLPYRKKVSIRFSKAKGRIRYYCR